MIICSLECHSWEKQQPKLTNAPQLPREQEVLYRTGREGQKAAENVRDPLHLRNQGIVFKFSSDKQHLWLCRAPPHAISTVQQGFVPFSVSSKGLQGISSATGVSILPSASPDFFLLFSFINAFSWHKPMSYCYCYFTHLLQELVSTEINNQNLGRQKT